MGRRKIGSGESVSDTVVIAAGGSLSVEWGGMIQVRAAAPAVRLGSEALLINGGTIIGGLAGVVAGGAARIVNDARARIIGDGGAAIQGDGALTVRNGGDILGGGIVASADIQLRNGPMASIIADVTSVPDAIRAASGVIHNDVQATITGRRHAILIDDGHGGAASDAVRIVNEGTITGKADAAVRIVGNHDDVIVNSGEMRADNVRDVLVTGGGNDRVVNNGTLWGGVSLGDGDDLYKGTGAVWGTIDGGAGDDRIFASAGNDTIVGGLGRDVLTGGAGSDRFNFYSLAESGATATAADRITDFDKQSGDVIDLSGIDASTTLAGNQAFSFVGTAAFSGTAGELRMEAYGKFTLLTADVDGDRVSDFALLLDGQFAPADLQFIL